MTEQEHFRFLATVSAKLAANKIDCDCHIVTPRFCGSQYYAYADKDFYLQLKNLFTAAAIASLDKVCGNAYWFLVLVGSSLVLADSNPADIDAVGLALTLQRRLTAQQVGTKLVQKVRDGNFKDLTAAEFTEAGLHSLIVIDTYDPEGDALYINQVLVG